MDADPNGLVAVLYCRVSDDRKKLSRSVSEQKAQGLAACNANGWIDGGHYEDNDLSGSRFAKKVRPDWVRLVEDILPSGRVQVLVLWEPARATRVLSVWARLLECCRDLGILLHITSHETTYDLTKPRQWKSLADDGVKAVYDSEETSLRVLRGVAALATTGKPTGKVLYGYERRYDPVTKEYVEQVIREDQAAVVRLVADWIGEGKSLGSLLAHLEAEKIPAPRGDRWSTVQLRKMALNVAYIGQRVHQGKVIGDAAWPPILKPEQHTKARNVLTAPGRSKQRDGAVHHELSGIVLCGKCSGVMRVQRSAGNRSRGHLVYICRKGRCASIRADVLTDYVWEVTTMRLLALDAGEVWSNADVADELDAAVAETKRLRGELEGYYRQAAPGVDPAERLSPLGLARMENEYVPLIEAAEAREAALRHPAVLRDLVRPDIVERWPGLQIGQRREVYRELMRVRVLPIGRGQRAPVEDRVEITWR